MRLVRIPLQLARRTLTITGGYRIAEAYCDVLSGKKVPDVSFMRTPLRLYDETTQEAANEKNTQKTTEIVNRTHELFVWSWRALLQKGVKLIVRDLLHPSRVENTLHIPSEKIRVWKEEAQKQNISVTDHDLLTAFIYQVCDLCSPDLPSSSNIYSPRTSNPCPKTTASYSASDDNSKTRLQCTTPV